MALKPTFGPSTTSSEVWIRGENLPEKGRRESRMCLISIVSVSFGEIRAQVVATDTNLLVVQTPIFPTNLDIEHVEVVVRDEVGKVIAGELRFSFHRNL